MKHHLNIILLALRASIIIMGAMAIWKLINAYSAFKYPDEAGDIVHSNFNVINKASPVDTDFLPPYLMLYALLLVYLVYVLVNLYRSFNNLEKGAVFYSKQSAEFKRGGAGLIIFAKCKYLLVCGFGAICFRDLTSFLSEIPMFLLVYLTGKLVLVLYFMAEKGEHLREETELTV